MGIIIKGNVVDIRAKRIFAAEVKIENDTITSIHEVDEKIEGNFILPGFIDAHVHIESSMLVPSEFARLAVVHGTVATISDPHEIANVNGMPGVAYMIDNGNTVPFKFHFGAPSCVPATIFETAGAKIDGRVERAGQRPDHPAERLQPGARLHPAAAAQTRGHVGPLRLLPRGGRRGG